MESSPPRHRKREPTQPQASDAFSTPQPKAEDSGVETKGPVSKPSPPHSRYEEIFTRLPKYDISSWKALQKLFLSLVVTVLSFHGLTLAPAWALPICWFFAALSMFVFFEIGNDCAGGNFFPSKTVNNLIGCFFLASVFQPLAYWKGRNQKLERRADFTKAWQSLCNSFAWSHLIVLFFAAVFFPLMIYNVGWWGLVKYWLIPFVLFQIGMTLYVKAGTHLERLYESSRSPWTLSVSLRSYLRFNHGVPSYRIGEATDTVQRMWNRASLDSSDSPAPSVQELLDNPSYFSLQLSYFSNAMAYTAIGALLIPVAMMWLYLIYSSGVVTWAQAIPIAEYQEQARHAVVRLVSVANLVIVTAVALLLYVVRKFHRHRSVYLVDFVTYTPPPELEKKMRVSKDRFKELQRAAGTFSQENLEFMDRLIERTGLGDSTYFPLGVVGTVEGQREQTMARAREEFTLVVFACIDQLFASTRCSPEEIDILVVNSSLFNPTPSLASIIVNKYKMRQDIQSYSLGGMGCSAGVISIHLARDLMQVHKNCRALVVSTENITLNWYLGNERAMLLQNTLFRVGGAAILLSNKRSDRARSKYRLCHSIRTHMGCDDNSFNAVYQDQDSSGLLGVRLSKELMKVAGEALKRNITQLGPLILPWSEQIRYFLNVFNRKIRKIRSKPYIPDFTTCIDHFCIHAGGRAVLEAIESALNLDPKKLEASRFVLHRYGNTSSSSVWYELAYLEKTGAVRAGHQIWQIAFGSGFKCNSAVWKAL